jgi:preprotein translocase subunit SecG
METVVIVIHLMVIVALVAVVLLQRSEGGALGVGGGNQFMSARGQGNVLTRATAILGGAFFATSMAMAVLARWEAPPTSILDTAPTAQTAPVTPPTTVPTTTAPTTGTGPTATGTGIIDELNRFTSGPTTTTPSTTAPDTSAPPAPTGSQVPTSQ